MLFWRKRTLFTIGSVAVAASLAIGSYGGPLPPDTTGTYVGTEQCQSCHPNAFTTWVMSDHARTGLFLRTMVGMDMMRKAMERERLTGEAFPCGLCHMPPGKPVSAHFGPDYHPEDGVQCETCHGPGGEHVRIEMIGDTLAGHKIALPRRDQDLCQGCHYDEKPFHDREMLRTPFFDYPTWWARIAHPRSADSSALRARKANISRSEERRSGE